MQYCSSELFFICLFTCNKVLQRSVEFVFFLCRFYGFWFVYEWTNNSWEFLFCFVLILNSLLLCLVLILFFFIFFYFFFFVLFCFNKFKFINDLWKMFICNVNYLFCFFFFVNKFYCFLYVIYLFIYKQFIVNSISYKFISFFLFFCI